MQCTEKCLDIYFKKMGKIMGPDVQYVGYKGDAQDTKDVSHVCGRLIETYGTCNLKEVHFMYRNELVAVDFHVGNYKCKGIVLASKLESEDFEEDQWYLLDSDGRKVTFADMAVAMRSRLSSLDAAPAAAGPAKKSAKRRRVSEDQQHFERRCARIERVMKDLEEGLVTLRDNIQDFYTASRMLSADVASLSSHRMTHADP